MKALAPHHIACNTSSRLSTISACTKASWPAPATRWPRRPHRFSLFRRSSSLGRHLACLTSPGAVSRRTGGSVRRCHQPHLQLRDRTRPSHHSTVGGSPTGMVRLALRNVTGPHTSDHSSKRMRTGMADWALSFLDKFHGARHRTRKEPTVMMLLGKHWSIALPGWGSRSAVRGSRPEWRSPRSVLTDSVTGLAGRNYTRTRTTFRV